MNNIKYIKKTTMYTINVKPMDISILSESKIINFILHLFKLLIFSVHILNSPIILRFSEEFDKCD